MIVNYSQGFYDLCITLGLDAIKQERIIESISNPESTKQYGIDPLALDQWMVASLKFGIALQLVDQEILDTYLKDLEEGLNNE